MADSSKNVRPFNFDVSFDAPRFSDQPTLEKDGPAPTFSLQELEEARQEGFADGEQAAREALNGSLEERIAAAIETIAMEFAAVEQCQTDANSRTEAQALELVRRIVERLLPKMVATHGLAEIEHALGQCLPLITENAKLTLRVTSEGAPDIERRLQEMLQQSGRNVQLTVIGDDDMGPADCALEWGDGGAERGYDALWAEIETMLTTAQESALENPAGAGPVDEGDAESVEDSGIAGTDTAAAPETETPEPETAAT